jgi:hypothetical protein
VDEYAPDQKRIDYRFVFGTEAGRRVFLDLMDFCKLLQPVHTPGDQVETTINEGKRNVFLYIMANVNPVKEDRAKFIREEILDYA